MDPVAERVARNDATFREANDGIASAAREAEVPQVPFICECADLRCTEIVRLSLAEYEQIRADSRRFINVDGHETAAQGYAEVVARCEGYVVVEKLGEAGELAERLDSDDRLAER
jgi:hypothetical protein